MFSSQLSLMELVLNLNGFKNDENNLEKNSFKHNSEYSFRFKSLRPNKKKSHRTTKFRHANLSSMNSFVLFEFVNKA